MKKSAVTEEFKSGDQVTWIPQAAGVARPKTATTAGGRTKNQSSRVAAAL